MLRRRPRSTRRRRVVPAVLVVAALAVLSVPAAPHPAAAGPAPLVTDEGLGIRVDETAFVPGALAAVATTARPAVTAILEQGASDHAAFAFDAVVAAYDLDLSVGFVAPGPGGADGTMVVTTEITDLVLTYTVRPPWPFAPCDIRITPDPVAVSADAPVDTGALPGPPFAPGGVSAENWAATGYGVSSTGVCWSYLTPDPIDWAAFTDRGDPTSPASLIDPVATATAVEAAEATWDGEVAPVLGSLTARAGLAVAVDQVRTDDHGLIVTADVDGTAGIMIGGVHGPYPVSGAVDAGVTSNVNSLLAQRSLGGVPSDVIVSLHPNVTNQFLAALTARLGGSFGTTAISSAVEAVLVDPTLGTCYDPAEWTTRLHAPVPPHLAPTGTGGAPEMQLSQVELQLRNPGCDPADPRVATFAGSMDDIPVAVTGSPLGPRAAATTAQWSATRTQADAATAARVPPATDADLLPWARGALATFLGVLVPDHVDLAPDGFPGHPAVPCSTCGRYPGDQRITATFHH